MSKGKIILIIIGALILALAIYKTVKYFQNKKVEEKKKETENIAPSTSENTQRQPPPRTRPVPTPPKDERGNDVRSGAQRSD